MRRRFQVFALDAKGYQKAESTRGEDLRRRNFEEKTSFPEGAQLRHVQTSEFSWIFLSRSYLGRPPGFRSTAGELSSELPRKSPTPRILVKKNFWKKKFKHQCLFYASSGSRTARVIKIFRMTERKKYKNLFVNNWFGRTAYLVAGDGRTDKIVSGPQSKPPPATRSGSTRAPASRSPSTSTSEKWHPPPSLQGTFLLFIFLLYGHSLAQAYSGL